MIQPPKARRILVTIIVLAVLSGQAAVTYAQDCAALRASEKSEREEFLEKKLAYEASKWTLAVIAKWRDDYGDDTLLSTKWAEVKGRISGQQQAAEAAEVGYLEASAELIDKCTDGQ